MNEMWMWLTVGVLLLLMSWGTEAHGPTQMGRLEAVRCSEAPHPLWRVCVWRYYAPIRAKVYRI